jgi:hypothetical protein
MASMSEFRTLKNLEKMKKTLLVLFFAMFAFAAIAQNEELAKPMKKKPKRVFDGNGIYNRDSTWKFGGFLGATISQTALYQWSPGGTNNFAILIGVNGYANYKKDKIIWDNSLEAKWGLVANGLIRRSALAKRNFQKNIDVLALKSNFGYALSSTLFASARFSVESQFTRSYDYSATDTTKGGFRRLTISRFGAPLILTVGPGITWKPKEYFTLTFSPATGKFTFVMLDNPGRDTSTLSDGRFTDNYYRNVDETRFGLLYGKSFMGELGAELDILFQKDIVKNISWRSHLNVFSAYLNPNYNTEMPRYYADADSMGFATVKGSTLHIPVVRWNNDIVFKVTKFLSATLSARFVYQYNALLPTDKRDNATKAKGADGQVDVDKFGKSILKNNGIQIFEQFGIGLAYKF